MTLPDMPQIIEIEVTHEGRGLVGVVQRLRSIGYYAVVSAAPGDMAILYGPRSNYLANRVPYLALIGDTIRVSDRSPLPQHERQQGN